MPIDAGAIYGADGPSKALGHEAPMPKERKGLDHPEDAPEHIKQSVDKLHDQLKAVPMPKADPRGSDPGAQPRDYGKYPASFPEKAAALAGAIREVWFGRKN